MRRLLRGLRAGTWGPILLGLTGVAFIWGGVFTPDPSLGFPPGSPVGIPDQQSWHSALHQVGPLVAPVTLAAACLVFTRRFLGMQRCGWAVYSIATPIAAFVLTSQVTGGDGAARKGPTEQAYPSSMRDVDELIDSLNGPERDAVQNLRAIVVRVVPDAEQGRSYGMAAFRYSGRPLIGVAVSKEHMSLHPFSPAVIEAVAEQLSGYSLSKGTIRFTAVAPVPDMVIEQLLRLRVAEIER